VADAAFFVPLDFRGFATRLLAAVRPAALALVETELWPNLLDEAHAAGVSVVLLNGRLSRSRMHHYRRFRRLYRPLLGRITTVGAQSQEDAERFGELGVRPEAITVTGNVKYDLPVPRPDTRELQRRLGAPAARPLFVGGSTGPGEDALVLDAFAHARHSSPDLLLALAPRHPERSTEVAGLIRAAGLSCVRYSSGSPVGKDVEVLLVDTVGDLPALYGAARLAFVGGSLVPIGGHNVLEPAAAGVPVLFGPHMQNFAEPAAALERMGGGRQVRDAGELGAALVTWLEDEARRDGAGRAARQVVEANRGALELSLSLLLDVLDAPGTDSAKGAE
jgi:3-deoxy-D-manno-octulosonic-acid transferase